jgi:hypothetical protein
MARCLAEIKAGRWPKQGQSQTRRGPPSREGPRPRSTPRHPAGPHTAAIPTRGHLRPGVVRPIRGGGGRGPWWACERGTSEEVPTRSTVPTAPATPAPSSAIPPRQGRYQAAAVSEHRPSALGIKGRMTCRAHGHRAAPGADQGRAPAEEASQRGVRPGADRERSPSDVIGGAISRSASWRARRDSNSRPSGPQPDALSTELRAPDEVAEREGFEPSEQVTPLTGLANRRTRPLCDLSSSAERW